MTRVAIVLVAALVLPACRPDTVNLAFRPTEGARYRYEVRVESETVTTLGGKSPERATSSFVLRADHEVLRTLGSTTEVRVRLQAGDDAPTTLVVKLDRAAQLAKVEQIEGLPTDVLGRLGLSELFPAAAGAPPDHPLAPGDRWTIDEPIQLTGGDATRIRGFGRLTELGLAGGRKVATVQTSYQLPIRRHAPDDPDTVLLEGTQTTTSDTAHNLLDGAIESAHSVSRGEFSLLLEPPAGQPGDPIRGTLEIDVSSSTRRVR